MPKASKKKYCQSSVDSAVDAVACGSTIRAASAQYGVPSSTLFGKLKNKAPVKASMGPSSILTATEEQHLVDWIFHVSERGFPITKEQLLNAVQKLVVELERKTPFTNNRPGRHWYEAFCRRHKELSERIAQNLTYSRASATEEKLRGWFQEVSQYLEGKGLLNIDPSRVYNCDESGFFLCPKADHVIVRKGAKRVYNVVNADEKENLTTLFMVNAAGMLVPPMVMFWYQRVPKSVTDNVPSGWSIGTSDRGWMTAETFFEYVTNVFYPWLQQNNVEFPVILYVDGHSSHCTLPLSNFCREKNIELIALYPNATHILQPLDVAVFHPLKSMWKKTVNQWRFENCGDRLKKEQFAPLLKVALDSLDLTATIRNGFRSCGLVPFSADAVDFNVLRKGMSSSGDTCHNDPSTLQAETKFVEHLRLMEQQLPANVISAFEESHRSGVWSGESTNEGLYQYWLKIKRLAANNEQNDIQLEALEEDGTRANDILDFAADLEIGFRSETESTFQQGDSIILTLNGDDIIDAESSEPVGVEVIDESCITILAEGCVNSIAEDSSEKIEGIVEECDENIAKIVEECNENIAEIVEEAIGTGVQSVVQTTGIKQNSLNTEEYAAEAVGETRRSPLNVLNSVNVQIVHNTPKNAAKKVEEIPSVFKNTLFWPEDRKKVTKKKKTTEKLPSVATSDQWLLLASQKEEEKLKMLQEKEERRMNREKIQEQKQVTQLEKQKLQEEKKKQQEEKKKEQEEIKKQQQEEKKKHQEEKKKQQQEEKMKKQEEKKKRQEEKKKQQQEEKKKQQEEKRKQQKENKKQQKENEKQQEENEKQQEENEKLEKEIEGKTNKVVVIVM
ncbi:uncharacterized protein [Temnothorax longispinosus]|uniref:uncharacterized protein n=1 Tax=Temnothorax longispinosus TaxID=300112 RepID=UPI003A99B5E1